MRKQNTGDRPPAQADGGLGRSYDRTEAADGHGGPDERTVEVAQGEPAASFVAYITAPGSNVNSCNDLSSIVGRVAVAIERAANDGRLDAEHAQAMRSRAFVALVWGEREELLALEIDLCSDGAR